MDEEKAIRDEIIEDMLSSYRPTQPGEDPDIEMTSVEVCDKFSEVIEVTPDTMSCYLKKYGFKLRLRGGVFRWQMNLC